MNCYTCRTSSICKVFDMVQSHKDSITIDVTRCNHYQQTDSTRAVQPVQSVLPAQPVEDTTNRARPIDEISTVAAKIKKLYELQEAVVESDEPQAEEAEAAENCIECDLPSTSTCDHCGAIVCENCLIHSASDNKDYCPGCWDRL